MPGAPFLHDTGTYQGVQGEGVRTVAPAPSGHWNFIVWLVLIGVVIPVLILGGLKIGGFSFVFRNR